MGGCISFCRIRSAIGVLEQHRTGTGGADAVNEAAGTLSALAESDAMQGARAEQCFDAGAIPLLAAQLHPTRGIDADALLNVVMAIANIAGIHRPARLQAISAPVGTELAAAFAHHLGAPAAVPAPNAEGESPKGMHVLLAWRMAEALDTVWGLAESEIKFARAAKSVQADWDTPALVRAVVFQIESQVKQAGTFGGYDSHSVPCLDKLCDVLMNTIKPKSIFQAAEADAVAAWKAHLAATATPAEWSACWTSAAVTIEAAQVAAVAVGESWKSVAARLQSAATVLRELAASATVSAPGEVAVEVKAN